MDRTWIYLLMMVSFAFDVSEIEGKCHGKRVHVSDATVEVSGRCATTTLGSTSYNESITIPDRDPAETPLVERVNSGHYRVSGGAVHMNYLKDQLEGKGASFHASRTDAMPELSVDVQAETVYIQGHVRLFGIRTLRMITRLLIGETGSSLDLSAPTWSEEVYNPVSPGGNGENGRDGFNGPTVEITATEIRGAFGIMTNGGDGLRGQNGGDGLNGADNNNQEPNARDIDCQHQRKPECPNVPPRQGTVGKPGGNGGSSGRGGDGGDSGRLLVLVNRVEGNVELRSCGGSGALPGINGRGGRGGLGSRSGKGAICRNWNPILNCMQMGILKAPPRRRGWSGSPGNTPDTRGADGYVGTESVRSGPPDKAPIKIFPLSLLRVTKRNADRLPWANDLTRARKGLTFLKLLTANREDATDIYKEDKPIVSRR